MFMIKENRIKEVDEKEKEQWEAEGYSVVKKQKLPTSKETQKAETPTNGGTAQNKADAL